jgi:hypothetical protein
MSHKSARTFSAGAATAAGIPAYVPRFASPAAMYAHLDATIATTPGGAVHNYCGVVENMSVDALVVETPLFPRDALDFYTRHNLCELDADGADKALYAKYYDAARGGGQGDYRLDLQPKLDNLLDCLRRYPQSKRAVLTIPPPSLDHTSDNDAKCLRELHYFIVDGALHCTGLMRANAASIFPKNIHYIGSLQHRLAAELGVTVGTYTHFVTTLISGREN